MSEEEDKWWSPDHVAGDEEVPTPQRRRKILPKRKLSKGNTDNFLEDTGYSDSGSKQRRERQPLEEITLLRLNHR